MLALELASDFADIFAVKRVEDLGAPGSREVAPSRPEHWDGAATLEFADDGFPARTLVHLARRRTSRTARRALPASARARRALAARSSPCNGS